MADFRKLQARVELLTWMLGANLGVSLAVLWRLLR